MESQSGKFSFRNSIRIKVLLIMITVSLIVLMFPKGEALEFEVTVGSIWLKDDLIATTSFPLLKDANTYENERVRAAEKVYHIFAKNDEVPQKAIDSLTSYSHILNELINLDLEQNSAAGYARTFLSPETYNTFRELKRVENILSERYDKSLDDCFLEVSRILQRIYRRGLIDRPFDEISKDSIAIRTGKFQTFNRKRRFYSINTAQLYITNHLSENFSSNNRVNLAVAAYASHFLIPDIKYDAELTQLAVAEAQDKISRNIGIVNENERIIAKHDRITEDTKLKIESYRSAKSSETGYWGKFLQNLGKFLHVLLIISLLSIYIFLFRKKIYNDNLKILLILIIILLISFIAFLLQQINVTAPVEYLVLIPVASMLLTIIFDSRIGFYTTIVVSLIVGALQGNDYVFAVMNIIAGAFAAYTVRDIKNRTQIFRSFLFILLGYITSIVAFGLERFETPENLLITAAFAASNALISPVFTFGLIVFVEKIFGITTDLTYLELTDFNHPLLKELARSAPGTFNHSMTIGSMVESASEVVGANPILARVGAYYHDIGKSLDPTNFVENQMSNINVHEKLEAERSAELIISHVKQGMDLAKHSKLPAEVVDFIPMHHGTMVVSYFYEKAKEEFGEKNIDVDDYRYPGPKPNSKETALVMLADACESAVRSVEDPDPQKVENLINNLIDKRIEDGQLDEAPLTFEDIKKIKQSFLGILLGHHHKRIRYPKQEEMERQPIEDEDEL